MKLTYELGNQQLLFLCCFKFNLMYAYDVRLYVVRQDT